MFSGLTQSQKKLLMAGGTGLYLLFSKRVGALPSAGGALVLYFLLEQAWPEPVQGAKDVAKERGMSDEAVPMDSKGFWGKDTWVDGGGSVDQQVSY